MDRSAEALSQLRSSHFWLVLVSFGLMAVPSLPLNTGYRNAYSQVSELMSINSTLSPASLAATFHSMKPPLAADLDVGRLAGGAGWHYGPTACRYIEEGSDASSSDAVIWMGVPGELTAYAVPHEFPKALSLAPADRTLSQVVKIWDFLNNGDQAFVIDGDAPPGAANLDLAPPGYDPRRFPKNVACTVSHLKWVSLQRSRDDQRAATLVLSGAMSVEYSGSGQGSTGGGGTFADQKLPVRIAPIDFPLFGAQLHRFFWHADPAATALNGQAFPDAFPDLVRVSAGLESLTLRELRGYTLRMMQEGGTDVDIFGAKLPIDIFMQWGVPLLIVMQLYFFLHLWTLTSGDGHISRVPQFVWIALYPGLLSRLVTFCSLALAPLAAWMLAHYGARYGFVGAWGHRALVTGVVASAVLAILTELTLLGYTRAR